MVLRLIDTEECEGGRVSGWAVELVFGPSARRASASSEDVDSEGASSAEAAQSSSLRRATLGRVGGAASESAMGSEGIRV